MSAETQTGDWLTDRLILKRPRSGRIAIAQTPPRKRFRASRSDGSPTNIVAPKGVPPLVPNLVLLSPCEIPEPTSAGIRIGDTLFIDSYRSSALTYAGKQRRRISESSAWVAEPIAFLYCAIAAPFPLNGPILPPRWLPRCSGIRRV